MGVLRIKLYDFYYVMYLDVFSFVVILDILGVKRVVFFSVVFGDFRFCGV